MKLLHSATAAAGISALASLGNAYAPLPPNNPCDQPCRQYNESHALSRSQVRLGKTIEHESSANGKISNPTIDAFCSLEREYGNLVEKYDISESGSRMDLANPVYKGRLEGIGFTIVYDPVVITEEGTRIEGVDAVFLRNPQDYAWFNQYLKARNEIDCSK